MPDSEVMEVPARRRKATVLAVSFLVLVTCFAGLFYLDTRWSGVSLILGLPAYLALEIIGGAAAEGLSVEGRWWGRFVVVLVVAVFYAFWFSRVIQ